MSSKKTNNRSNNNKASSQNGKKERAVSPKVKATPNPKPQKAKDSKRRSQDEVQKSTGKPTTEVIVPEVVDDHHEGQSFKIVSDSTSVIEFSLMENKKYSEEIINNVKDTFNIDKLNKLKGDRKKYLAEARDQINALWKGIHALNIHTLMFTVLLLIYIGIIFKEIKDAFEKPHAFAKWRDNTFGIRHKRLFQQAVQLESMGDFSRKYSPLGKERLLQLEHIRKTEGMESCEDILKECPVYDEIAESSLSDDVVKKMDEEPFPDISYDLDNELVKLYVNSIITLKRLQHLGMDYVDFGHAQLIASYYERAMPAKLATSLKEHMKKFQKKKRPEIFDSIVMDGMKTVSLNGGSKKSEYSLNKVVSDLLRFSEENSIDDEDWLEQQKDVVNANDVIQARDYLNRLANKMGLTHNRRASIR